MPVRTPYVRKEKDMTKNSGIKREPQIYMEKYINAVRWYFGFTKKEAIEYIHTVTPEMLTEIMRTYMNNAYFSFVED